YGSGGRLLGVNALDAYARGIVANVATHELLHQWEAYETTALGISDGIHYGVRTSVGSLIGGFRWLPDGAGGFLLDCTEGRGGAPPPTRARSRRRSPTRTRAADSGPRSRASSARARPGTARSSPAATARSKATRSATTATRTPATAAARRAGGKRARSSSA